jgi:hypothetical protein
LFPTGSNAGSQSVLQEAQEGSWFLKSQNAKFLVTKLHFKQGKSKKKKKKPNEQCMGFCLGKRPTDYKENVRKPLN